MEAGDLLLAQRELDRLAAKSGDAAQIEQAQHRIDDAKRAQQVREYSLTPAAMVFQETWRDDSLREEAIVEFLARATHEIDDQWEARDAIELEFIAQALTQASVDATLARKATGLAEIVRGYQCLENGDLVCAVKQHDKVEGREETSTELAAFARACADALASEARRLAATNDGRDAMAVVVDLDKAIGCASIYERLTGSKLDDIDTTDLEGRRDLAKQRWETERDKLAAKQTKAAARRNRKKGSSSSEVGQPTRVGGQPSGSSCCRVCSSGKPCGNSCISLSKSCHQPPGCAC